MGIYWVGQIAVLTGVASGLTIALSDLPGVAAEQSALAAIRQVSLEETVTQPEESTPQIAQIAQADTDCRQTNTVTGVYQQPNSVSVAQGVLPAGQTVRLEVLGVGTGWSRIREPIVGWVEARYLTPPTPCTVSALVSPSRSSQASTAPASSTPAPQASVSSTQPTQTLPQVNPPQATVARSLPNPSSDFPQPTLPNGQPQVTVPPLQTSPQTALPQNNPVAVRPTVPPVPAIAAPRTTSAQGEIVSAVCDVLPREGLVVRPQPNLNSAGVSVIPAGTYNFQFTGATQAIGSQRLVYIVAPTQGWIEMSTQDGSSTLGGGRCG